MFSFRVQQTAVVLALVTDSTKGAVNKTASGADGQTVMVTEVVSGDGAPETVDRAFLTGPDGSLSIDTGGFFGSTPVFTVTATGDDILVPAVSELESGKPSTGTTFVEFTALGTPCATT